MAEVGVARCWWNRLQVRQGTGGYYTLGRQSMRTFPKELAELRRRVNAFGQALRVRFREDLIALGAGSTEEWDVGGRPATVALVVEPRHDGALRVVVQAFMPSKWLPFVSDVALDGFYQTEGGSTEPIPVDEWREFDKRLSLRSERCSRTVYAGYFLRAQLGARHVWQHSPNEGLPNRRLQPTAPGAIMRRRG